MSQNKPFVSLAKFVAYEVWEAKGNYPEKIVITYTQPNGKEPTKEFKGYMEENKASDAMINYLEELKAGDEFSVHLVKNESTGYWELSNISKPEDAKKKEAEYKEKSAGKNKWQGSKSKDYDGDGAQVGNALTNAATIIGAGHSVKELEQTAWEIIEAGERLKAKLQTKRKTATKTEDNKESGKTEKKKSSRFSGLKEKKAEKQEVEDDVPFEVDDLEDISFADGDE